MWYNFKINLKSMKSLGTKKLECISPDGTERRVFKDALNYPFSLAIFNRHFYYTDWER